MVRLHHNKRRHQFTITIDLPSALQLKRLYRHAVTALLLIIGIGGIAYGVIPLLLQPEATAVPARPVIDSQTPDVATLSASPPVRLIVEKIGIDTPVIKTGKNPDGTMAVPDRYDVAAWYEHSPAPGELGPSIIVGHVDNYLGPAVFFALKELQPGDRITITREDGKVVTYTVDSVALFDQNDFPTDAVYGNIDHVGLRLITCGGTFNPLTGYYLQNTVVYASAVTQ